MEQLELSYTVGDTVKSYNHLGKLWCGCLTKVKQMPTLCLNLLSSSIHPTEMSEYVHNSFKNVRRHNSPKLKTNHNVYPHENHNNGIVLE